MATLMDRHPLAIASACYVLLALVLTGPALVGRAALGPDQWLDWDPLYRTAPPPALPMLGDLSPTVLHYPRDLAFARGLHAGRLDVWNPLAAAGAPLWVEQGGPFFPLKLPFYAAPSPQTYNLFLVLRLVTAAIGAYLLARFRAQPPLFALAGGAMFELSGAMLAQLPFGNGSPVYMLPWIVLGSFAIAQRRSVLATVGTGIALGLAASGGHPTLILMVFAAFAAAVAGHCVAAWRRPATAVTIAGCGAAAVALGLALAAASLLPLAELTSIGTTYKDRPIGDATRTWNLGRSRALLSTSLFASRALATLPSVERLADLSPSLGTLALFATITAACSGRLHPALLSVAALGVGLALAPPGLGAVALIPGLRLVLPLYAWPLIALPATHAVCDGVRVLTTSHGWRRGAIALALFIASGIALQPLWRLWMLPAAVAGLALGACALLHRARLGTLAAAGFIVVMVGEQLFTVAPLTPRPASTVVAGAASPAVQFLQQRLARGDARFVALPIFLGCPLTPMLFGLPDLRAALPLPVRRYVDYLQAISPEVAVFTMQAVVKTKSPLLDLAAVRYVVLPVATSDEPTLKPSEEPAENDPSLRRVYEDARVRIYENQAALPRARVVHRTVSMVDQAAARNWAQALGTRAETARELGFADVVVLEPDEAGQDPPALWGDGSERESVQIDDQEDPDRLVIAVRLDSPGFLVIADTYYPGWQAWVDGTRTSLYPANLLFRALYVPAGTHAVELRYEPKAFFYGACLSALAALLCVLLIVRRGPSGAGAPSRRSGVASAGTG